MSLIVDGTTGVTFNDSSLQGAAASPYVLKNRIINGAMGISQRNGTSSTTPTADATFTLDRWAARLTQSSKFSVQQVSDAPSGFVNSFKATSLSSYAVTSTDYFGVDQRIEGLNWYDLAWGTSAAKTVTLSFWVKSSLTGTFGGSLFGYQNGYPSYVFSYSISAANTWTQISITIAGSTTGTWATDNSGSVVVNFSLGSGSTMVSTANVWNNSTLYRSVTGETSVVGTNAATWQFTGVQLEIGTSATPFERRLYNQELANCQRYYYASILGNAAGSATPGPVGWAESSTQAYAALQFPVNMRTEPSMTYFGTASSYRIRTTGGGSITCTGAPSSVNTTINNTWVGATVSSGLTGGQCVSIAGAAANASLNFSAEL